MTVCAARPELCTSHRKWQEAYLFTEAAKIMVITLEQNILVSLTLMHSTRRLAMEQNYEALALASPKETPIKLINTKLSYIWLEASFFKTTYILISQAVHGKCWHQVHWGSSQLSACVVCKHSIGLHDLQCLSVQAAVRFRHPTISAVIDLAQVQFHTSIIETREGFADYPCSNVAPLRECTLYVKDSCVTERHSYRGVSQRDGRGNTCGGFNSLEFPFFPKVTLSPGKLTSG